MKAVLISIQPKWCEKIANGEKTIEVRKSRPKLKTPFKVYIYCTKEKRKDDFITISGAFGLIRCPECAIYNRAKEYDCNGRVIGEFVCDRISEYRAEFTDLHHFNAMHEDVCLNEIKKVGYYDEDDGDREYYYETSNAEENPDDCDLLKGSCLTFNELRKYIGSTFYDKSFYGWHISDLKIYDKPKELSEFKHDTILHTRFNGYKEPLKKPPQSWCYVEELQNEYKSKV